MLFTELQNQIIAILFAAGDPVEVSRLEEALDILHEEMGVHMQNLASLLDQQEFPLELRKLENSWQLCSRPVYGELVRRTLEMGRSTPLTPAALEVLAIIAYNQPVTRSFVEQIRGVDSSSVVTSLAEKGLVEEAGRLDLPGRPISYRTTQLFLRTFGLEDLTQLPVIDPSDRESPPEVLDDGEVQLDFASLKAAEENPQPQDPEAQDPAQEA